MLHEHATERQLQVKNIRRAFSSILRVQAEEVSSLVAQEEATADAGSSSHPVPVKLLSTRKPPPGGSDLRQDLGQGKDVLLPGLVDRHQVKVVVDTGANVSLISREFAVAQQLKVHSFVDLEVTGIGGTNPRVGQVEVDLSVNAFHHLVLLEVCPGSVVRQDGTAEVLLGNDIAPAFGIAVTLNMPQRRSGGTLEHLIHASLEEEDASDPDHQPNSLFNQEDRLSDEVVRLLEDSTKLAFEANAAIPANSFCSHPNATVPIDTGSSAPTWNRERPLSAAKEAPVRAQIESWRAEGVVAPAPLMSAYNSALLAASKRHLEGNWTGTRVCLDLRSLNAITIPVDYPIPLIADLFRKLRGFVIASSLDLRSSYTQFRLREEDQEKTTFRHQGETLMFKRACFGLRNMTSFFQTVMTDILRQEGCASFCLNFVDDLLIWSASIEEHADHVNRVVNALNRFHLRLNIGKTKLGYSKIRLLGHLLDGKARSLDARKLQDVLDFPVPKTGKQVQSLCGLLSYLREYVPLFSAIAGPLEALKRKKTISPGDWEGAPSEALTSFKKILTSAPVLCHPDPQRQLIVATDASNLGLGACLYQETPDGGRDYIAFASKALSGPRLNYGACKRELCGVLFALTKWRRLLLGRHFRLEGDHQSLSFLLESSRGSMVLENWLSSILEYSFDFRYIPGPRNVVPDALSRLYPEQVFRIRNRSQGEPVAVRRAEPGAAEVKTDRVEPLLSAESETSFGAKALASFIREYTDKESPSKSKQADLLQSAHAEGHFGARFVFRKIWEQGFYWPKLLQDAQQLISTCRPCLRHNVAKRGFLPSMPDWSLAPMDHISCDLLHLEPTARGNLYVLVCLDVASRFVWLRPLQNEAAATIAQAFLQIFSEFGTPRILSSDNGSEFRNDVMSGLAKLFETKQTFSAPYNPEANGATERHVSTAKLCLRKMLQGNTVGWDLLLPAVQASINSKLAPVTKTAPSMLMLGRTLRPQGPGATAADPRICPSDAGILSASERIAARWLGITSTIYPAILGAVKSRRQAAASRQNLKRRQTQPLVPGSVVYIKDPHRSKSLDPIWLGPYRVLSRTGNSYRLMDATMAVLARNVPHTQIKLISAPQPAAADVSYVVDKIKAERVSDGVKQYLVAFKGYGSEYDEWLPADNFDDETPVATFARKQAAPAVAQARRQRPAVSSPPVRQPSQPSDSTNSSEDLSPNDLTPNAVEPTNMRPQRARVPNTRPQRARIPSSRLKDFV